MPLEATAKQINNKSPKMLHALVKIEKEIKYDDEYDAIAVGLTHLSRVRPSAH